jgi:hypothetical protein
MSGNRRGLKLTARSPAFGILTPLPEMTGLEQSGRAAD